MKYEVFIALNDTADAYSDNFQIEDVEKAINEDYAPSLVHKEFDSEEQMRGFQDGLEFCAEECGCRKFWLSCQIMMKKGKF